MSHFEINRVGDLLVISAVTSDRATPALDEDDLEVGAKEDSFGDGSAFPRRITLQGWLLHD